jgi:ATP-dependent RNA helicase RhlE
MKVLHPNGYRLSLCFHEGNEQKSKGSRCSSAAKHLLNYPRKGYSFMTYQRNVRPARPQNRQRPGVRTFRPGKAPRSNQRGAYIHPSKFINRATTVAETIIYEPKHSFVDFAFTAALQRNIEEKGYITPSAIQDQSIPLMLEGKDVIGLANTGTGKTAAFLLPIIEHLYANRDYTSVLIMAPTRELAQQIDEQFRDFSYGMKLFSALCVGGMNIDRQIRDLRRGPHVVIGTPGRLKDLIQRRELKLDAVKVLVLDEADRMLDMGFINDIRMIVEKTPSDRQTLFFSATITPTIQQLVQAFLRNPETVSVRTADTSQQVDQDIIEAGSKEEKLSILTNMFSDEAFDKVLVFGETKFGVQRLSDHLEKSGLTSVAIHGNKSQSQRQRALKAFKDNKVRIMVATDVAARGLDIPNVSHVINFDQPATYEDYVHRIGRTGRAGASGKALTFVPPQSR